MSVAKRNRMTALERVVFVVACAAGAAFWPAVILFVSSLSLEWQVLIAAAGLGLFGLGAAAGLLAAVAGLFCRR